MDKERTDGDILLGLWLLKRTGQITDEEYDWEMQKFLEEQNERKNGNDGNLE